MSRYLYNAAYFWEVVVDKRNPQVGLSIYLEERSTGKRRFLKNVSAKDLESVCRTIQKDLYLTEEEFEANYGVQLSSHASIDRDPAETMPENGFPQPV